MPTKKKITNTAQAKLAIVGASGQLGSQFINDYPKHTIAFSPSDLDITDKTTFEGLERTRPRVIINCAAYTNVDKAEIEPDLAYAVNADGAANLAQLARKIDALLVQISTDYVFDGKSTRPYFEEDPTNPINVYGKTKLEGEKAVMNSGARYLILRTAWLYGGKGPNFILKMIGLGRQHPQVKVVDDQIGSPTFTKDLAEATMALIKNRQTGLFNAVNAGQTSRFELTKEIFRLSGLVAKVIAAKSADFPTPAARPTYSVLATSKLARFYRPRAWQDALKEYIGQIQ